MFRRRWTSAVVHEYLAMRSFLLPNYQWSKSKPRLPAHRCAKVQIPGQKTQQQLWFENRYCVSGYVKGFGTTFFFETAKHVVSDKYEEECGFKSLSMLCLPYIQDVVEREKHAEERVLQRFPGQFVEQRLMPEGRHARILAWISPGCRRRTPYSLQDGNAIYRATRRPLLVHLSDCLCSTVFLGSHDSSSFFEPASAGVRTMKSNALCGLRVVV